MLHVAAIVLLVAAFNYFRCCMLLQFTDSSCRSLQVRLVGYYRVLYVAASYCKYFRLLQVTIGFCRLLYRLLQVTVRLLQVTVGCGRLLQILYAAASFWKLMKVTAGYGRTCSYFRSQ